MFLAFSRVIEAFRNTYWAGCLPGPTPCVCMWPLSSQLGYRPFRGQTKTRQCPSEEGDPPEQSHKQATHYRVLPALCHSLCLQLSDNPPTALYDYFHRLIHLGCSSFHQWVQLYLSLTLKGLGSSHRNSLTPTLFCSFVDIVIQPVRHC